MLFSLSGSRWPGTCSAIDWRPPADAYCQHGPRLPRIDLRKATGGVPVLSGPTSVTIDGEVVASSTYRLDNARWLTRLADEFGANPGWPHRQRLDLATTEDGTFVISGFTFGAMPPTGGEKGWRRCRACKLEEARSRRAAVQPRVALGSPPEEPNRRKTHCPRGHPDEGPNVYVDPKGNRRCRECKRLNRSPATPRATSSSLVESSSNGPHR